MNTKIASILTLISVVLTLNSSCTPLQHSKRIESFNTASKVPTKPVIVRSKQLSNIDRALLQAKLDRIINN